MNLTNSSANQPRQHVYEVSELNKNIKRLLEEKFPFIWISGEISNFRKPSSGHCYFTLKDRTSQISAVLFRGQAAALKFKPEDGLSVIGLGRIGVYEPRGSYQIILEYMEPKGIGGLQIAFERLKQQLSDEGLFDNRYKVALPVLPQQVSIVTSASGAAIRDFIKVAQRRFVNLPLAVVPVPVQGDRAPAAIVAAIRMLNQTATSDVIVLTRGGGSIEDLSAFNDEQVARAIFASRIPIVSAIGHETDFTIADFVADLRAPTPSAAAELVVPSKNELQKQLFEFNQRLYQTINSSLKLLLNHINGVHNRIVHPRHKLQDWRLRLDDLYTRLIALAGDSLERRREMVAYRQSMLMQGSPAKTLSTLKVQVNNGHRALISALNRMIQNRQAAVFANTSMLDALNPMAILQRGYSITRRLPERTIVRSARQVAVDQELEVLLGSGKLTVTVKQKQLKDRSDA